MPDVSVIAFLRNNASCLARTIESLQQQSLSDWEIASLLANDQTWPSDDERLDQLRRYLFEPNYGTASRKAADILLGLLTEPTPVREPMESAITG